MLVSGSVLHGAPRACAISRSDKTCCRLSATPTHVQIYDTHTRTHTRIYVAVIVIMMMMMMMVIVMTMMMMIMMIMITLTIIVTIGIRIIATTVIPRITISHYDHFAIRVSISFPFLLHYCGDEKIAVISLDMSYS